jgi:hypothetical protein
MKKAGALLFVIGALITVLTVFPFTFTTNKKIVDIGELEIHQKESHSLPWKPIVGATIMAVGLCFYLIGTKRPLSHG